jgi:hypothetical protein
MKLTPPPFICAIAFLLGHLTSIASPGNLSAAINSNDVTCYGDSNGVILLNVAGSSPPFTYHWSNGDSLDAIYYLAAGQYYVTVHDAANDSIVVLAIVAQPPMLFLTFQLSADTDCPANSVNATVIAGGGNPPYDYAATYDGINWIYSTVNVFRGLSPGKFTVLLSDRNACTFEADTTIYACPTGIAELNTGKGDFQLFPNPSTGPTQLALNGLQAQHIRIYSMTGAQIADIEKPENNSFDISRFSNGIYFVEAEVNGVWVKLRLGKL